MHLICFVYVVKVTIVVVVLSKTSDKRHFWLWALTVVFILTELSMASKERPIPLATETFKSAEAEGDIVVVLRYLSISIYRGSIKPSNVIAVIIVVLILVTKWYNNNWIINR